jgi:hypothetical protein
LQIFGFGSGPQHLDAQVHRKRKKVPMSMGEQRVVWKIDRETCESPAYRAIYHRVAVHTPFLLIEHRRADRARLAIAVLATYGKLL